MARKSKVTEFIEEISKEDIVNGETNADGVLELTGDKFAETMVNVGAVADNNALADIQDGVTAYRHVAAKKIFDETKKSFDAGAKSMTAKVGDFNGNITASSLNNIVEGVAGQNPYKTVPVNVKLKANTIPGYAKMKTAFVQSIVND